MASMKIDLSQYANMNICVAVSGGRDSMALLHYLLAHGAEYGISVSVVNFDHKIRGETSARDSAFVKEYCKERGVPLLFYEWNCEEQKTEASAREWRRERYVDAAEHFNAAVATAHHLNDNAETVLFNLARGSGLSGMTGICDTKIAFGGRQITLIRPLIGCSREEIDAYIAENNIPYVDDETNFTDDYTRNKIRRNILPELERAVPNAAKAIYRFSRIASEDEEYLSHQASEYLVVGTNSALIKHCEVKPLFSRAVLAVVAGVMFQRKDYTAAHIEALYNLQFLETGKTFEFLGLIAYKEEGRIAICQKREKISKTLPFGVYEQSICFGELFSIKKYTENDENRFINNLFFDFDKVPKDAVIRTRRAGDKFTKFGGGTKSLGDFMTDRKIPVRMRDFLPVIAVGSEILAVIGVEISDKIKVDSGTKNKYTITCIWC